MLGSFWFDFLSTFPWKGGLIVTAITKEMMQRIVRIMKVGINPPKTAAIKEPAKAPKPKPW